MMVFICMVVTISVRVSLITIPRIVWIIGDTSTYSWNYQKTVQVIDEKQDISLRGLKLLYQHLAMALDICLSLNMNNSLATLCCST